MFFHIYAGVASAGLIQAIARKRFSGDPAFDRSMAAGDACGEGDRMLRGFTAFAERATSAGAKRVFVFDLLDRVDVARGSELAALLLSLLAAGIEIHATSMCGQNELACAVLDAIRAAGYKVVCTPSEFIGGGEQP